MNKGFDSLRADVLRDVLPKDKISKASGVTVFSAPANMICPSETGCNNECKHTHRYCSKFKWILERAEQYAKHVGKTRDEVLRVWEEHRSYWYMNYYGETSHPDLSDGKIKVILFDNWIVKLKEKFGDNPAQWKFKCPACKNIQCGQDFIDNGIEDFNSKVYYNCIGRYVKGKGCDWSLGGLLQIHDTIVLKDMLPVPVFEMA